MAQAVDICVIGGGIQGAGVAQSAALSGLSVVLVEKTGWAAGTSSKSSKLIHEDCAISRHYSLDSFAKAFASVVRY